MTSNEWPFTPEVESGGWQVAEHHGRYWLDEDHHERNEAQESANVNLIAAAPRMYRALKEFLDAGPPRELDRAIKTANEVINWIDQQ